ncbi:hypothetical protein Syun_021267 [Stephania yunnanensis]|uniref:Uncharacterized protein n=1 Tax=Stephania yunnanensis TaxID=152371 RepID=A0AAP0IFR0_9MAGN
METQLDRMEALMNRIEEEVKRISSIEASIDELKSEVKNAMRGLARRCHELSCHHLEIASTKSREQHTEAFISTIASNMLDPMVSEFKKQPIDLRSKVKSEIWLVLQIEEPLLQPLVNSMKGTGVQLIKETYVVKHPNLASPMMLEDNPNASGTDPFPSPPPPPDMFTTSNLLPDPVPSYATSTNPLLVNSGMHFVLSFVDPFLKKMFVCACDSQTIHDFQPSRLKVLFYMDMGSLFGVVKRTMRDRVLLFCECVLYFEIGSLVVCSSYHFASLDPPPWPPPRPSMLLNKASTDVVNRNDFPSISFSYSTPRALSIAIPLEKKVTFEQQSFHGDQMERKLPPHQCLCHRSCVLVHNSRLYVFLLWPLVYSQLVYSPSHLKLLVQLGCMLLERIAQQWQSINGDVDHVGVVVFVEHVTWNVHQWRLLLMDAWEPNVVPFMDVTRFRRAMILLVPFGNIKGHVYQLNASMEFYQVGLRGFPHFVHVHEGYYSRCDFLYIAFDVFAEMFSTNRRLGGTLCGLVVQCHYCSH